MASTQEFYRLRGRNVRFSTQLQSLAKGMYLTGQNMPEGYAKVLVNYDIDDTGSCLQGKVVIYTFQFLILVIIN